jgi:hypothetical protein
MPKYEQRGARVRLEASDDEDALRQVDTAATAMNETGASLACRASLALPATPPRRLDPLPRQALIVSRAQAQAAVAGMPDPHGCALVRLELAGPLLSVTVAGKQATYELSGALSADPLPTAERRAQLLMPAAELTRQVADAVADDEPEVALSCPTGRGDHNRG